jgi:membrane protein DedA with SNARE-associated domain
VVPELHEFWPFLVAFGSLVAAGFGAPIPEELPTLGAGIWVGSHPEFGPLRWLILPLCFLGVFISDMMLYGIGRFWGPRILQRRWVQRMISPETWGRIEDNYHRYGIKALLMVRWLPAIRSPMFLSAGVMRLSFPRFAMADGVALVIGHTALFFFAYWLGDQSMEILQRVESVRPLIVIVVLTALATYLVLHFLKRPVATGAPDDLPPLLTQVTGKMTETVSGIIKHVPEPHGPSPADTTLTGKVDRETVIIEKPLEKPAENRHAENQQVGNAPAETEPAKEMPKAE